MNRYFFAIFLIPLLAFGDDPQVEARLRVETQDIVSSETTRFDGRNITFQKLDPERMERKAALAELTRRNQPVPTPEPTDGAEVDKRPVRPLMLGASVMILHADHPENALTRLELWPAGGGKPIILWINANFLWLTNRKLGVQTADSRYELFLLASEGGHNVPENLPFPDLAKASLVIAEGDPTEEQLAPIDALLEIYNTRRETLRANYEACLREAKEKSMNEALHPTEKKDLIIRYWRTDGSARNANGNIENR